MSTAVINNEWIQAEVAGAKEASAAADRDREEPAGGGGTGGSRSSS